MVLRAIVAKGLARRERAFHGKELVLDLLFPGDRPNTRAGRHPPHLPDELFSVIVRYYWGGGLWPEEEAAAAAEAAAVQTATRVAAEEAEFPDDY